MDTSEVDAEHIVVARHAVLEHERVHVVAIAGSDRVVAESSDKCSTQQIRCDQQNKPTKRGVENAFKMIKSKQKSQLHQI